MDVPFVHGAGVVEDAYTVLGLPREASEREVRAAWRRAAREKHPDVGGDAVAFRVAREAYETLIDPERRAAHDRLLDARRATGPDPDMAEGPYRSEPDPGSAPVRQHAVRRTHEWVLIAANGVVVLRALDVLRGLRVLPPSDGAFLFPLPGGGSRFWVSVMNLLEVPWAFLVLAAVAIATLVTELVHERCEGVPLLDVRQRALARKAQAAVPSPLALGVLLAAATLILQFVLMLLTVAVILVGGMLALSVLRKR